MKPSALHGPVSYTPEPIATDAVELPKALNGLTECLAEHVHDVWAQRRIQEGWTYGATRDDEAKTHPGLVPYEQLPEPEKAYDRATALETLRAIFALGYSIRPFGADDADPFDG